jgi:hypothetical protein
MVCRPGTSERHVRVRVVQEEGDLATPSAGSHEIEAFRPAQAAAFLREGLSSPR